MPDYAVGEAFARSREAFAEAEAWLGGPLAAGLEHGELEGQMESRGRELLRLMLQDHLDLRAAREPRAAGAAGADGAWRTRAERGHSRLLASVFGPVTVTRIAYRAAGAGNAHPADAALNLPREKHSHGLRRMAASAAARGSFGQACAEVTRLTGSSLHRRQCEELTRRAAADFAGFYAGRRRGPAPGDVLALSCDGKGIVVLPSQMRPERARKARRTRPPKQDGRLSRGETRDRKRMAEVCAVYDVAPAPRTAEAILGPRPDGAGRPQAPRAAGKWLTAGLAGSAAEVVATAFAEADRRDPDRERTWIALADGNTHQIARIRAEAAARGIAVTVIIDFIHVIERLWTAAWCFLPEASPDAAPWVRARAAAILGGRAGEVAAGIRGTAATGALSRAKHREAAGIAAYLDAKAPYLDYPTALASGWPIGTGVIEGACRHLVKDRMDITGARWTVTTAEAILQLRALHANGDFGAYWAYHLQRERERNHPAHHDLAA